MPSRGLVIDYETADRITISTLKDHLGYLKDELRKHREEDKWMHPDDLKDCLYRIPQLEDIIKYFSGNH